MEPTREITEPRAKIERGPAIGLILDYSGLDPSSRVGVNFTPFGITKVDAERTIFSQIPLGVIFGQEGELKEKVPAPLLRDNEQAARPIPPAYRCHQGAG